MEQGNGKGVRQKEQQSYYGGTRVPIPHLLFALGDGKELNFPQGNSVFPVVRTGEWSVFILACELLHFIFSFLAAPRLIC